MQKRVIEKLKEEATTLDKKIKYRDLYNIRNKALNVLYNSVLTLDYATPFFLSFVLCWGIQGFIFHDSPFVVDEYEEPKIEHEIQTSTGKYCESTVDEKELSTPILEHSTAWQKNSSDKYERTITNYIFDNDINSDNFYNLIGMTKEEIDEKVITLSTNTIEKSSISSEEDQLYTEDAIVLHTFSYSEDEFNKVKQSDLVNVLLTLLYISQGLGYGVVIAALKSYFIPDPIRDKMYEWKTKHKILKGEELVLCKKQLKLKVDNLELLGETLDIDTPTERLERPKIKRKI